MILSIDLQESSLNWLAATGLPPSVLAGQTLRHGAGHSLAPFDTFNLALHVGDDPATVQANRMALLQQLAPYGCERLVWLNQVHGTEVYRATADVQIEVPTADAVVTDQIGVGCVIMTADCLPVVLSSADGREVACSHAGWRGLLSGVIEAAAHAMKEPPVYAWLGAAIGAESFEVGPEVRDQFVQDDPASAEAFTALPNGKDKADLYQLARLRLMGLGIERVSGGEHCTVLNQDQFFSYRRDQQTGRMATVVMIRP
ncbi:peptidoglycan editing factor PgeF [Aquirhabdus parva]|uniref:Purine nucleoside phosphorylase n=1 Tax=Aquirhabdus parva TaxID=2283318 RepID=A0A345P4K4_9GAMM|nr:peptidoglycan editing factor PgeF [Aquirhabdus parva]